MQGKQTNFQKLKVFENEKINQICDDLCTMIYKITGETLYICGSMAKVFSGELPESYTPKDVDFAIRDPLAFRLLKQNLSSVKLNGIQMIEVQPYRLILYTTEKICLEIWLEIISLESVEKKYKSKIKYLSHGNKI